MADKTTTEPSVEMALAELRQMFPRRYTFKVERRVYGYQDGRVKESAMVVLSKYPKYFYGRTIEDCMDQVRAWHAEQAKES